MKIKLSIIVFLFFINHFVTAQNNAPQTFYTCVMHPEIHSPKPGKCPKCGMALVKEKAKPIKKAVVKKPVATKKVISETKKEASKPIEETPKIVEVPKDIPISESKPIVKTIAKTVRYDLYVRDTLVTIGNKPTRAIAVNGQIPMPTLTFTEGDTAEIYVHNELKESTSLHWHGLFLPNKEDGVPYLTQMPIEPGTTHKYTVIRVCKNKSECTVQ
jgi:hypothetical protein